MNSRKLPTQEPSDEEIDVLARAFMSNDDGILLLEDHRGFARDVLARYGAAQPSYPKITEGWPTDKMVVRGAEEVFDCLRQYGIEIDGLNGTDVEQYIAESVFGAMIGAAPEPPADEQALWCIHIPGPDDVYAAPTHLEAVQCAAAFNTAMRPVLEEQMAMASDDAREYMPSVESYLAHVARWPHSRESHAESLGEWTPEDWVASGSRSTGVPVSGLVEALEALEDARQFIVNGIELGYIRMPDRDTPDAAHDTLPKIEAALASFRKQGDEA